MSSSEWRLDFDLIGSMITTNLLNKPQFDIFLARSLKEAKDFSILQFAVNIIQTHCINGWQNEFKLCPDDLHFTIHCMRNLERTTEDPPDYLRECLRHLPVNRSPPTLVPTEPAPFIQPERAEKVDTPVVVLQRQKTEPKPEEPKILRRRHDHPQRFTSRTRRQPNNQGSSYSYPSSARSYSNLARRDSDHSNMTAPMSASRTLDLPGSKIKPAIYKPPFVSTKFENQGQGSSANKAHTATNQEPRPYKPPFKTSPFGTPFRTQLPGSSSQYVRQLPGSPSASGSSSIFGANTSASKHKENMSGSNPKGLERQGSGIYKSGFQGPVRSGVTNPKPSSPFNSPFDPSLSYGTMNGDGDRRPKGSDKNKPIFKSPFHSPFSYESSNDEEVKGGVKLKVGPSSPFTNTTYRSFTPPIYNNPFRSTRMPWESDSIYLQRMTAKSPVTFPSSMTSRFKSHFLEIPIMDDPALKGNGTEQPKSEAFDLAGYRYRPERSPVLSDDAVSEPTETICSRSLVHKPYTNSSTESTQIEQRPGIYKCQSSNIFKENEGQQKGQTPGVGLEKGQYSTAFVQQVGGQHSSHDFYKGQSSSAKVEQGQVQNVGSSELERNVSETQIIKPPPKTFEGFGETFFKDWMPIHNAYISRPFESMKDDFVLFLKSFAKTELLKTKRFFLIFLEILANNCLTLSNKYVQSTPVPELLESSASLVRFITLWVYHCGRAQRMRGNVILLPEFLQIITRNLFNDAERLRVEFISAPFKNMFLLLLKDMTGNVFKSCMNTILVHFGTAFHQIRPDQVPGFGFAWLELISNPMFIQRFLKSYEPYWWVIAQLLEDIFKYLRPFLLRRSESRGIRTFYKGTLRLVIMILHKYPKFLDSFVYRFLDTIPPNAIQLRNIITSSHPQKEGFQDPFERETFNLIPKICKSVQTKLSFNIDVLIVPKQFKDSIDLYLNQRAPATFVFEIKDWLKLNTPDALGFNHNVSLINALVLYIGIHGLEVIDLMNQEIEFNTIVDSPNFEILFNVTQELDEEGRYLFLSAIVNQLRYPCTLTHYFIYVTLSLFLHTRNEVIKEEIARNLLERVLVFRPWPWGVIVTLVELGTNNLYNYWSRPFNKPRPEGTLLHKINTTMPRGYDPHPCEPWRDLEQSQS